MAAANVEICSICTSYYDTSHRQLVSLPCGHDFCLSCLVRLRASGKHKCPRCRRNWAGVNLPTLLGMEVFAAALQVDQEDENDVDKKKNSDDRCKKHSMPYDFWVNAKKEFYCRRCAAEDKSGAQLEVIEDAIPLIKAALTADVSEVQVKAGDDLKSLDGVHANLVKKRNSVKELMKAVKTLDDNFDQEIENVSALRAKTLERSVEMKKVEGKVNNIKSPADLGVAIECKSILKKVVAASSVPASDLLQTLLCNIACVYAKNEDTDELPSSAAFISRLMKATENSALPLTKAALDADKLKEGDWWDVDNTNCLAAILALTDRQPAHLCMISRPDEPEPLPAAAVAAVAKAARKGEVWLELHHSFIRPEHHSTDQELLEHILDNSSLRLTRFFGHLDAAGIAKLPTTVYTLGLAIGSAADATAVTGLKPWDKLESFHVSVSSDVAACDLSQLPSVGILLLHFPGLTDARVDSVRPAIEALVPDLKFSGLVFPLSQLTASGTHRLRQQMRSARNDNVTIDPSSPWWPRQAEKERVKEELLSAVGCGWVRWDMG